MMVVSPRCLRRRRRTSPSSTRSQNASCGMTPASGFRRGGLGEIEGPAPNLVAGGFIEQWNQMRGSRDQVDVGWSCTTFARTRPAPPPRAGLQPANFFLSAKPCPRVSIFGADHPAEKMVRSVPGDLPRPLRDLPDGRKVAGAARAVQPTSLPIARLLARQTRPRCLRSKGTKRRARVSRSARARPRGVPPSRLESPSCPLLAARGSQQPCRPRSPSRNFLPSISRWRYPAAETGRLVHLGMSVIDLLCRGVHEARPRQSLSSSCSSPVDSHRLIQTIPFHLDAQLQRPRSFHHHRPAGAPLGRSSRRRPSGQHDERAVPRSIRPR